MIMPIRWTNGILMKMKKIKLLLLSVIAILFSSCNEERVVIFKDNGIVISVSENQFVDIQQKYVVRVRSNILVENIYSRADFDDFFFPTDTLYSVGDTIYIR